jgi:hypothetical protein
MHRTEGRHYDHVIHPVTWFFRSAVTAPPGQGGAIGGAIVPELWFSHYYHRLRLAWCLARCV